LVPVHDIEISVNGVWTRVKALNVAGRNIIVRGQVIRVASVHDEWWMQSPVDNPGSILEQLQGSSGALKADLFTFAQRVTVPLPIYEFPFEWDSVAAIRLTTFAEWWQGLPQESRKNTRRAAKRGVTIGIRQLDDRLVEDIVALNNDSPLRQGRAFSHYGKTFDEVRKDHSAFLDRADFLCAYLGNELVGFLKIVYCDGLGAILQLTTKGSHFDKKPANALLAAAVERCEQQNLPFITYGKFRYGNQERTSLMEFKGRNGFEEILVPRYYVPLTLKGRLAMKLKLHHDLVGVLPRPAIVLGRRVRSNWYRLRHGLSSGERTSAA
jgi:hypothetical protein